MRYYAFSMSEKNQVVNKKWKFSVIKNNPGTFRVSWSRIPSRHPGSKYTYLVICKRVKSTRIKIARAMNSRSAVIDILQPKTKYSIRVIAFDTSRANRKPIYSRPQLVKTLDGKIRLVGWSKKATNTAGRVEIFYKGHWRKICYTVGFWSSWRSWDLNNANVVCRSLGLPRAVAAPHSVVFGIGTSPTWIKKVHCRGTETSLFQCRRNTVWRGRKCHKDNYASVVCFVPPVYLNVTTLAGVISSPGYPRYMKQARYEWTFVLPVIPRARMALYFESIDLSGHQYLGNSNVTLQDLSGHQLFHLSNTKSEPLFLIQNKTTKLVYYSWFTRRGKGLRVRYLFYRPFDEALLQNASILASSTSPHSISVSIGSFTVDGFKVLGYFITCNSTDDWHRTASYAIADNKTKTASCHRLVGLANYKVQVFAVGTNATDGSMMMYKSNPNEIKTLEGVPSQSPSGFHVVSSTSSTIHVQWNPLPRDHANGILLGYKVEYCDTFHLRRSKTITTNNTQVVLEHDLPGMVYRITVRGFTGKGQGPFSTTELYTKCGGIEQQAQGTMSHPPYNYRSWSLNCWWTLKAPSKMGMIVISLYVYSEDCGSYFAALFNNADEMVHRLCKTRREIFFAYISFGTAKLQSYTARLVFLGSSFVMKAKYYMFENGLDDGTDD
ncbi:uncharacterized protein LOC116304983 [Actinia tenebrosa]|uniref:Uncharacterized protein LOC116304983 n=1 Tax=Actinia tenebrosa TaxID=6105 RepID=A0A6P8IXK8_ACTTE|nr:uncharacterized protein LOC116304983 [Actinia tenebrosa]